MEKLTRGGPPGVFLGVKRRSSELMVATPEGVIHVRAIHRLPQEKRWSEDCVEWVKWAPWNRYKDADDADGEVPEGVPVEKDEPKKTEGDKVVFTQTREPIPRDFYISLKGVEKHGSTRGCDGCSSMCRGKGRAPHNNQCRDRLRELLKETTKMQNYEIRKREFEDREEERKKRREEKKKRSGKRSRRK